MHYHPKGNYMVLFGGRKFASLDSKSGSDSEFVNEVCILKMDSLEWCEITYKDKTFPELYNFSSALVED